MLSIGLSQRLLHGSLQSLQASSSYPLLYLCLLHYHAARRMCWVWGWWIMILPKSHSKPTIFHYFNPTVSVESQKGRRYALFFSHWMRVNFLCVPLVCLKMSICKGVRFTRCTHDFHFFFPFEGGGHRSLHRCQLKLLCVGLFCFMSLNARVQCALYYFSGLDYLLRSADVQMVRLDVFFWLSRSLFFVNPDGNWGIWSNYLLHSPVYSNFFFKSLYLSVSSY